MWYTSEACSCTDTDQQSDVEAMEDMESPVTCKLGTWLLSCIIEESGLVHQEHSTER